MKFLKVYNETIRDLLMPSGCLPIREDPSNGVVVHGLSLHKVSMLASFLLFASELIR